MNTWADLHGEDGSTTPTRPSRTAKFCMNCQCWVERADMKRWSPDGTYTHFLCDGCDAELDEPECNEPEIEEETRDDYHHSQHMEQEQVEG